MLRLCILLPIFTSTVLSSRFLSEAQNRRNVELISCVETIARLFFTGIENVAVISSESNSIAAELIRRIGGRFCVNLSDGRRGTDFNTVDYFIVLTEDSEEDPYEAVINMTLNQRGRYVFVTRGKPDVLRIAASKFWTSGIPDVIFVQDSKDEGSVTVFGYEVTSRYKNGRIRIFDRWKFGRFVKGSNLFPSKFSNMENYPLKVTVVNTLEMQPDIYVTRSKDGEITIAGVGSNLVNLFAKKHNFKLQVFEHFSYGEKENGTWSGPAAQLINGQADLTFAGLIPVPAVIEDFEYSDSYRWDAFHFVTKSAGRTVSWMSLFKPLSRVVWTCGLSVFLAIFWLVHTLRKFHSLDIVKEHVEPIDVVRIYMNQNVRYPKTTRLRLAFLGLMMYTFLMLTCYNSSLVNRLSQPTFGPNPKTMAELVKLKIEIGGIYAFKYLLGNTGDPVDRKIHDRFVNLMARQFWTLLSTKDRAVTVYRTSAIRHNWRYRLNESMQAHLIEDPIIGIPFMYYMRKGHPYLNPLNNFIRKIRSSGLIVKWMSDYNAMKMEKRRGNETVVLTVEHFAGVFILLVCGHIVGTIRFLYELYF